jgi:hypothetical protein
MAASFFRFVVKHIYFGNTMSNCGVGTLEFMKRDTVCKPSLPSI